MSKTTFVKDYKTYYDEVVEYSIAVHRKFASHNTFLFFIYGLSLYFFDIKNKMISCGLCFAVCAISLITYAISTRNLSKKKRLATVIFNVYLFLFLLLLTLFYNARSGHIAYTVLLCSMITTAMTNMVPMYYISILLFVCLIDNVLHFGFGEVGSLIDIISYVLNDLLIVVFCIGINILFSAMKFREFHQKHFLQNESYHDPLTKIFNRRYVERFVDLSFGDTDEWAMFLMDIDNFKMVNDSMGHEYGDELLCRISEILRNNFRKTDCVARIGGDEFVILMPRVDDKNVVIEKAKNILENFPFEIEDTMGYQSVTVSVSIGIAFSRRGVASSYEEMYRKADAYMYKAKNKGKGIAVMEGVDGKRDQVIIG